ncbi:MAG: hypothetical protein KC457_16700 [Myxococcales bacterium]|nr:hypothetical protein [Myxococcales bacterium]
MSAPRLAMAAACVALSLSSPALAGNEAHVRTPVLWQPAPACGVVVDRSVDPWLHLDYAIPGEDTALTTEELPDSRRQQFFALCRDRAADELLPPWITRDDVDRSVEAGLLPADTVEPAAILDESPAWAGCFTRITADDQRRPITWDQAALGVDWDTASVDTGVWLVAGYTFEPVLNLWSPRPGFIKIVDDSDDPQQDVPALALTVEQQVLEAGTTIELGGCIDAEMPALIHLEWTAFAPTLDWQDAGEIAISEDGALALPFPTPATEGEILIRATVTDAQGRSFVAHGPAPLTVIPCDGECAPDVDPTPEDGDGCGCSSTPRREFAPWLLLLAILPLRRRSRRTRLRENEESTGKFGRASVEASTD